MKMIEGMLAESTGALVRAWRRRLDGQTAVRHALSEPVDDAMLAVLLDEYVQALCHRGFAGGVPALAEQTPAISVFSDPRDDAALWIEILSAGRAVLESYLMDSVAPGLGLSDSEREDLLDELERAFHMVAHRRLQVLCDCCLTTR
ncbi:MAG: hypothetical protein IT577_18340 [Verrucomicrobiae bacterium]|nr:hypothetical protein [Verrucomicrobiae bacterium]